MSSPLPVVLIIVAFTRGLSDPGASALQEECGNCQQVWVESESEYMHYMEKGSEDICTPQGHPEHDCENGEDPGDLVYGPCSWAHTECQGGGDEELLALAADGVLTLREAEKIWGLHPTKAFLNAEKTTLRWYPCSGEPMEFPVQGMDH